MAIWTLVESLIGRHDPLVVGLAALVCAAASFAAIVLLNHARQTSGRMRRVWLAIAATATGFGIWSTHFVAMIAFSPGFATSYDLGLTLLSLLVALLFAATGMHMAIEGERRSDPFLGGAITGLGISAMHFIGMASLVVGGQIAWNPALVAFSILFGMLLGGVAFHFGLADTRIRSKVIGVGLFTLAVVSMHFTAMSAAGFENCYAIVGANDGLSALMPVSIALVSVLIGVAAMISVWQEVRSRMRDEREQDRMRGLANAAVEGLVVCDGDGIVTANESFCRFAGIDAASATGRRISEFIDAHDIANLSTQEHVTVETEIRNVEGESVAVELILREIDYGGRPMKAIAVRDLRDRRQAEQYIRFMAHHDSLTGLPNRTSFTQRLQREITAARRQNTRVAVLALDLDRFKEVNDLFGHAAGDELLKRVGACLTELAGGEILASRLSGDEFAIIVPDVGMPAEAGQFAQKVLDCFASENRKTDDNLTLAASIGVALFPDDAATDADLLNHADTALYRAKHEGRGTWCFFEANMGKQVRERRLLEHDLRHSVTNDQLRLVFQPQVRIDDSKVTGFEALLRWDHPLRGRVSPADFIPLAEETGLIIKIGEWVLRTACEEAAGWQNPIRIAVNVSAVQLHAPAFAGLVETVLKETGLDANRLEIEITESALVKDMDRAVAALKRVKALGVRIAMDDFGTGYSSLSNLRAFDFDKIKVDQSFIRSVDGSEQSAAIVRAVLGLGRGLKLPVLAEGVERFEELDFLRDESCSEVQGFLVSRPMEISELAEYTDGRVKRWPGGDVKTLPKAAGAV